MPLPFKSRSGHFAPPTKIQYYGNDGTRILSAGRDRALRMFSTVRDAQNYEFSQGHIAKKAKSRGVTEESLKLPIVTEFASGTFLSSYSTKCTSFIFMMDILILCFL